MYSLQVALVITLGVIFLTNIPSSESLLWDVLIDANVEEPIITSEEIPVIFGNTVDHAGKPIADAQVQIRMGPEAVLVYTNSTGGFYYEAVGIPMYPGVHIVNVMATSPEGKVGMTSLDFRVSGDVEVYSDTAKILQTQEAVRYLHASPESFEKDPIGMTLYNYYQEMQQKFFEEVKEQEKIEEDLTHLEELRKVSDDLEQQIIEEKNPGAGTYAGWKYDRFVSNLDPSVRDLIVNQLNHTTNNFEEAQLIMDEILANGGTLEEARKAYLDTVAVSRETMDQLTTFETFIPEPEIAEEPIDTTNQEAVQVETPTKEPESEDLEFEIDGTTISVGSSGTTIFLNVNGTVIEFFVNGTQITQITNSSNN